MLRNLWRRKVRTSLMVAGIAIGIAVMVALLVVAQGLATNDDLPKGTGQGIFIGP